MIVNPYVFGGLPQSTLLNGLHAVYKFQVNQLDSLGNYNGTLVGTANYTTGINGLSIIANGTNYVSLPDNTFNLLGTTFTIAVWYKKASPTTTGNKTLVSTYNSLYGATAGFELNAYGDGSGVMFNLYGSSSRSTTTGNGVLPSNQWNLIVVERITGTRTTIYVNNAQMANMVDAMDILYAPQLYASIGAFKYNSTDALQNIPSPHQYDEAMFWNRELTFTERSDLYNSGIGKFYPTFL